jgi:N-acetylmuramoyl-L-alanine amidase
VVRLPTLVIEAGPRGEDPGPRGRPRTLENDVNQLIANRLKAAIDAEPGMRAVRTRDGD